MRQKFHGGLVQQSVSFRASLEQNFTVRRENWTDTDFLLRGPLCPANPTPITMRKVSPRYGPGQRWRSGTVESDAGPVDGPDAWDGYPAAVVSQAVLASMSRGVLPGWNLCRCL